MPVKTLIEKHFTATEAERDVVIGISDGLTVPFALAANLGGEPGRRTLAADLSAAVVGASVIVKAGLAEVATGAIAMELGGYLAAHGCRAFRLGDGPRRR
jgi:hypothetical protein